MVDERMVISHDGHQQGVRHGQMLRLKARSHNIRRYLMQTLQGDCDLVRDRGFTCCVENKRA